MSVDTTVSTAQPVQLIRDVTVDPASIAANVSLDVSVTVTGAKTSMHPVVSIQSLEADVVVSHAWVSAADTIKVRLGNLTGSAIDPVSATWTFICF